MSIHIEQWWEDLIEEQQLAEELEKQGYSYKEAMDLIRKHGVNHVKWLLEGGRK